jgi:hypothetical protein
MQKWKVQVRRVFREWRSNIIVWFVQWIGGSAMISAIGRVAWKEFHRAPLDWYFIGAVFLIGLILVVVGIVLQQKHAIFTEDKLKEIEAKIPQPTTVDGVLAGLPKQAATNWREPFRKPQWEVMNGHTFKNTTVELDGKSFQNCTFENVSWMFRGRAPVEICEGLRLSGNYIFCNVNLTSAETTGILNAWLRIKTKNGNRYTGNRIEKLSDWVLVEHFFDPRFNMSNSRDIP